MLVNIKNIYDAPSCSKVSYTSTDEAKSEANKLHKRYNKKLSQYRCLYCNKIHLTSMKKSRSRRASIFIKLEIQNNKLEIEEELRIKYNFKHYRKYGR